MLTDNDITKDKNESYNAGQQHWGQFWSEARTDIKFYQGDHYTAKDKQYLISQDREALTFGKCRRIVHVVTGYEQKNLLALKIDPFEGADEKTASQFSALVMNNMFFGNGYKIMSEGFGFGPVLSGMNLVEPWVDRSEDLLNGDIRFRRLPYNRYVLDPTFTDNDLDRDCNFIFTRDYFSKEDCMALLPERTEDIKLLKGGSTDSKFGYFYPMKGKNDEYNLKYDRFYTRVQRPYMIMADTQTGRMVPLPVNDPRVGDLVRVFMQQFPNLRIIRGARKGVDLHIFIENELMYSGPDPSGLDEYPFVLENGYYTPEDDDPKYRLQGLMRCMRDPGKEVDRRRSMILDMMDSVIRQGWKAKSGKVVNPDELYSAGTGNVVWMKEDASMDDAERLQNADIPAGLFKILEIMDKDHDEMTGVNSEMLGSPENENIEVAAILAKLRSANGLTTLQSIFGNHRFAKTLLGRKQIKLIQKNYTPVKVQRILGEQPTREFYTKDWGKYDCIPTEGILTDSQRQMYFAQLTAWKKAGAPIPWSELINYAPIERKDSLKEAMKRQEQSQSQQAQQDMLTQKITNELLNAEKFQTLASGRQKLSQIREDMAGARLDNAKALKELEGIDIDNFMKTLNLLQVMADILVRNENPRAEEVPQLAEMNTVGEA